MYTAIIFEPRQHKALSFVLNNFLDNLSNDWNVIIFYGRKNKDYVLNILNQLEEKDRIKGIQMNIDNMTPEQYSELLLNKETYEYIPSETFLIFQTDSMLFEKNKLLINEFLKYDYVGAPWPFPLFNKYSVGNGGLSLRKKSKMLEILEKSSNKHTVEDLFFSCNDFVYVPSFEEAKHFSIEHVYCDSAFGCHKPWISKDYNKILKNYPEVENLRLLNIKYSLERRQRQTLIWSK